jgi:hypothetical protein
MDVWDDIIGRLERLTMIIDRESSSADPPQQLRERKKELILELKDCGGGAVMSYMGRESVCVCVLVAATSSNRRAEMEDDWVSPPWLDEKSCEELGLLLYAFKLSWTTSTSACVGGL